MSKKSTQTVRIAVDQELSKNIRTRIITLLDRKNGTWNGTMTDLNRAITAGLRRTVPTNWPKSASVLRRVVNTIVPSLRRSGVHVQFCRTSDHMRTRLVSFEQNSNY